MYQYTVHKLDTKHLEQKPQHAEVRQQNLPRFEIPPSTVIMYNLSAANV